jgi:hypothetical protein
MNAIKSEHGLYLVLAPGLLLDHALSGSEQTAIFDFYPGGDIDSYEFSVPVAAGKFAAIHLIGFACPFFVFCRDISGIYYYAFDAFFS